MNRMRQENIVLAKEKLKQGNSAAAIEHFQVILSDYCEEGLVMCMCLIVYFSTYGWYSC